MNIEEIERNAKLQAGMVEYIALIEKEFSVPRDTAKKIGIALCNRSIDVAAETLNMGAEHGVKEMVHLLNQIVQGASATIDALNDPTL